MPDQRASLNGILRVLLVEDEALVADYLADIIEEAGHEVAGFAATGEKALLFLDRQHFDLAILDIKLKGKLSGIEVAESVRQRAILHMFISGSGDLATRQAAEATGPLAFLQKPFSQETLVSVLKEAVNLAGLSGQAPGS
jgi:CheY-like chemotaxis protein